MNYKTANKRYYRPNYLFALAVLVVIGAIVTTTVQAQRADEPVQMARQADAPSKVIGSGVGSRVEIR